MNNLQDLDDSPDDVLIRGFLAGEETSFRRLHARHAPRLRNVIGRLLGPRRAEVDDVAQETWMAACRGLRAFRSESRFSTWLITIGIRTTYRRLTESREIFMDIPDDHPAPAGAPITTVIDLERAIAALPAHQRVVLVLHDVEGFTHEEIARQIGCAVGTSKGTLSRARNAIRNAMSEEAVNAI